MKNHRFPLSVFSIGTACLLVQMLIGQFLLGCPSAGWIVTATLIALLACALWVWSGTAHNRQDPQQVTIAQKELHDLQFRAQRDSLTELYNRESTQECITQMLITQPSSRHLFVMIDLDNFKSINDRMGHLYGDDVLREISRRIRSVFPPGSIIGRIGGDEFVVFLSDILSDSYVQSQMEFLNSLLRQPVRTTSVSCSIGGVCYPADGKTFDELFRSADRELYRAKQNGKACFSLSESLKVCQP